MGELRLYYPLQDIVEELGVRPFLISLSAAFQSLSSKLVSFGHLAVPPPGSAARPAWKYLLTTGSIVRKAYDSK
jgi:hypothetical protein